MSARLVMLVVRAVGEVHLRDWHLGAFQQVPGTDFAAPTLPTLLAPTLLIDTTDTPSPDIARMSGHDSMRQSINDYARSRLESFVQSLERPQTPINLHLNWGTPWRDMCEMVSSL